MFLTATSRTGERRRVVYMYTGTPRPKAHKTYAKTNANTLVAVVAITASWSGRITD